MISQLLSPQQTARALGTTSGCLAVWRCTRRYPLRFTKIGRKIFYREEDVQAFIEQGGIAGDSPKPPKPPKTPKTKAKPTPVESSEKPRQAPKRKR